MNTYNYGTAASINLVQRTRGRLAICMCQVMARRNGNSNNDDHGAWTSEHEIVVIRLTVFRLAQCCPTRRSAHAASGYRSMPPTLIHEQLDHALSKCGSIQNELQPSLLRGAVVPACSAHGQHL